MISLGGFFFSIERDYFGTFFDTRTGKAFLCDLWRNGTADKERFYVCSKHKSYYKSINKDLKLWLTTNWDIWEEEKPDWFTARMIGKIPSGVLPDKVRDELGKNKRDRKKSIAAMIKVEEVENEDKKKAKNDGR